MLFTSPPRLALTVLLVLNLSLRGYQVEGIDDLSEAHTYMILGARILKLQVICSKPLGGVCGPRY